MEYTPISKPTARPNLTEYEQARREFSWQDVRRDLDGLPGGGLNIAHECLDRHLSTTRRDKVAML